MKILCISSLTSAWSLHGRQEFTLLKALQIRGATIDCYLCDGLKTACATFLKNSSDEEIKKACALCAKEGRKRGQETGIETRSLLDLSTKEDKVRAKDWAHSLSSNQYAAACYETVPLGEWLLPCLMSKLRFSEYVPGDNAEIDAEFQSYLETGVRLVLVLERLFDATHYDRVVLFNGRFESERIVRELAARRNIPYYTHERGHSKNQFLLNKDDWSTSVNRLFESWESWKNVPLSLEQIEDVALYQWHRELGDEAVIQWQAMTSRGFEDPLLMRQKLGIDPKHTIWALFPSSTDELVADPEFSKTNLHGQQREWIEMALGLAAAYPHVHVVLRVHPNMAAKKWGGRNSEEDLSWFKALAAQGRPRLTVIDAGDSFSTYDLMQIATIGLSYVSTCSLEMGLHGKASCCGAIVHVSGLETIDRLFTKSQMQERFDRYAAIPDGFRCKEKQRAAFRFLYFIMNRWSFPYPFVVLNGASGSSLALDDPKALFPGKDRFLDAICKTILEGGVPLNLPGEDDLRRSTSDEDGVFSSPLDVYALATGVSLKRGEFDLPENGVLQFGSKKSSANRHVLTGWRRISKTLALVGASGSLAFGVSPDVGPMVVRLTFFAPKGRRVNVFLNETKIGTVTGSGWWKQAIMTKPDDCVLKDVNRLEFQSEALDDLAKPVPKVSFALEEAAFFFPKSAKERGGVNRTMSERLHALRLQASLFFKKRKKKFS